MNKPLLDCFIAFVAHFLLNLRSVKYKFCFAGSSALTGSIVKNLTNLSAIVQWDVVDGLLPTSYTVTWYIWRNQTQAVAVAQQTSYTITGLTLDTVYTITVTAANMCGNGPAFKTSVVFPTGTYVYSYLGTSY